MLNWNGARDTIECLETVLKSDYSNYSVVVVDNDSEDDSVEKIRAWAAGGVDEIPTRFPHLVRPHVGKPIPLLEIEIGGGDGPAGSVTRESAKGEAPGSIVLVRNGENSGFAAGNNLGIDIAKTLFRSEYYFILNNDTVIESDALSRLVLKMESDRSAGAVTAAIYFYAEPDRVANEGGEITRFAGRRYHTRPAGEEFRRVAFATGCALLVRREVIETHGLLSERFFFGEEDFDFSWRLKKNGIPLFCSTRSRVYHKIGVSEEKYLPVDMHRRYLYIYRRVIDMKHHMGRATWVSWRFLLLGYTVLWLALKYGVKVGEALSFAGGLRRHTNRYDDARKGTIEAISRDISTKWNPDRT